MSVGRREKGEERRGDQALVGTKTLVERGVVRERRD